MKQVTRGMMAKGFAITTVLCFTLYLLLTVGSGTNPLYWCWEEITAGIVFAVLAGYISSRVLIPRTSRLANPGRFFLFIIYLMGPFFAGVIRANLDVAKRVITGKINPGIVKITPRLRTDLARLMLANSITLTPGTLTVHIDDRTGDFYVHWINVKTPEPKGEDVYRSFEKWVRRIAE